MRKTKWITRRKVYLNGVLTQRNNFLLLKRTLDIGLKNLGPIYSKNLTNNDATIRTSNKNNCELETVKKERDNNKY